MGNSTARSDLEEEDVDPKDRATSQSYQSLINDCNYKLALCLRRQEKWEEAGKLYLKIIRFIRFSDRVALISSLFGVMLLPMVQDRRLIANELETLRDSLIEYKDIRESVKRPLYNTYFEPQTKRWLHPKDAAIELSSRSFFCRFSPKDL